MPEKHHIILFDGYCNLCNAAVRFVIKHDTMNLFGFVSLSSALGKALTSGATLNKQSKDSIVYLENKNIYYRSTAILRIMKKLGKGWQLLYIFIIIPPCIRDVLYDLIAVNRYRWFGKRDKCAVLPPDRMPDDSIFDEPNNTQDLRS